MTESQVDHQAVEQLNSLLQAGKTLRSEERRVGKEWRPRRSRGREEQNTRRGEEDEALRRPTSGDRRGDADTW